MFPDFPKGATIPSILAAWEQVGGPRLRSRNKWGSSVIHPAGAGLYGKELRRFAEDHFRDTLSIEELWRHHSLIPIHLSLYDMNDRARAEKVRQSWKKSDRFLTNFGAVRLCPFCVEEDIQRYGCGHWRREHQLRHVSICTRHGVELRDRCVTPCCDTAFGTIPRLLPSQPCPACKGNLSANVEPEVAGDGYTSFCKLFTDALEMSIPEVTPGNRGSLLAFGYDVCGGQPADLRPMLLDWLGARAPHTLNAVEIAVSWLMKPEYTQLMLPVLPSWFLLAAFKRHVEGPPTSPPEHHWH